MRNKFKKGHPYYGGIRKGSKRSEENKRKIKEAMKGKRNSPATEFKKGNPQPKGKLSPNWKGGLTSIAQTIRNSLEYRLWRTAVFERDHYTCRFCGKKGGRLNADHIKPFADYPELRFAIDNGRTLCEDCHKKTPTYLNLNKMG